MEMPMEFKDQKSEYICNNLGIVRNLISVLPDSINRIDVLAQNVEGGDMPKRCRALLFSNDGKNIAIIGRERDGCSYAVLPGGGVEGADFNAIDTVNRELYEELSIKADQFTVYEEEAIEMEPDVWVFLAVANDKNIELSLGDDSPEAFRNGNSERGFYYPVWLPVENLASLNLRPYHFRDAIAEAISKQ
ncbi:MAG: NUDIX domain-containing protein [Candidatus Nanosynbacter sp.]|nr:NUDIX domain-containing protein [Candidatus Nanosynbacter sp.]